MKPVIHVVEDQDDLRLSICDELRRRGYAPVGTPHGEKAFSVLHGSGTKPALILLDIQLPGRDGYQLLEDLKKLEGDRSWKVVALTAHAMPADRERALAAGFDGYITKPIDVRALPAEVARYLSSPAPP